MNVISNDNMKCAIALQGLRDVNDPEIGLNIVDLGLVYQLDFDEEQRTVYCSMTLTTQFCPMGNSILDAAAQKLGSVFDGHRVVMQLCFDPPWNADRISEAGRIFLNAR
jgi:metal-sulfur cluster biosynthetic enzyme